MSNDVLEFGGFRLEPAERRLTRGGEVVDVNGRYFDALLLLARRPGELITKDSFMAEVWRGVPVTDEALTQCIRTLRKALGDQAGNPRFIETVPRHGYRFVAEVRTTGTAASTADGGDGGTQSTHAPRREINAPLAEGSASGAASRPKAFLAHLKVDPGFSSNAGSSQFLMIAAAGLAGGAAAGLIGGIAYGLLAATEPPAGTGAVSILLVMTCLCILIGLVGGLGVGSGSALGRLVAAGRLFPAMLGGALGGLVVGSLGRLIGLDAFSLLIGSRPLAITGGSEGLLIGAMAGAGMWLAERSAGGRLAATACKGALLGAIAGLLVALGGGKMMAGSLAGLAAVHPDAPLGRMLGELTPPLLLVAGVVEGAIFIAALTLAFALVLRSRSAS